MRAIKNSELSVVVILATFFCFALVFKQTGRRSPPQTATVLSSHGLASATSSSQCIPTFKSYKPSAWEEDWYMQREKLNEDAELVCKKLNEKVYKVDTWLKATAASAATTTLPSTIDSSVFSKFVYEDSCTNKELDVYIEPLVGKYRHPLSVPLCKAPGNVVPIEARDYLLLHGMNPEDTHRLYPGKKYLFDLGSRWFSTSIWWFIQAYRVKGIEFDEIWGWEMEVVHPHDYYREVPADVLPKLHFYNVAVGAGKDDPSNPLNIIKRIVKPGDFVVFKLDIDNAPLELSFVDSILEDGDVLSKISEMMFEMHFLDRVHMAEWALFSDCAGNTTWLDVFEKFRALRSKGVRIHYWP